jgi:hypothetical protein
MHCILQHKSKSLKDFFFEIEIKSTTFGIFVVFDNLFF